MRYNDIKVYNSSDKQINAYIKVLMLPVDVDEMTSLCKEIVNKIAEKAENGYVNICQIGGYYKSRRW